MEVISYEIGIRIYENKNQFLAEVHVPLRNCSLTYSRRSPSRAVAGLLSDALPLLTYKPNRNSNS